MLPFIKREKADENFVYSTKNGNGKGLNDCTKSGFQAGGCPTVKHFSACTDSCMRRDPLSLLGGGSGLTKTDRTVVEDVILDMLIYQPSTNNS
ncbi:hypothetical protein TNIN_371691 [Trichonephila inaurata madagascariensis]|uniref:Uncharacterized protein n=1 Tax=Trichonephila inaurata madagascariensis TaxID=2747483 RepID=A0A8X7C3J2_9ARAC|nr:hypothetical protein TNIN_371691 [Trichonephila inaurata madagascariensis]